MKLSPGDLAAQFSTADVNGEPVSLDQFRGRHLLLMFFRYASCLMCNLRLHDFAKEYPRLNRQGLSVVAFFHSPGAAIKRNAGAEGYDFSIVSDPDEEIYRA